MAPLSGKITGQQDKNYIFVPYMPHLIAAGSPKLSGYLVIKNKEGEEGGNEKLRGSLGRQEPPSTPGAMIFTVAVNAPIG